eukprot:6718-Heterococcus_DN1.PRE.3
MTSVYCCCSIRQAKQAHYGKHGVCADRLLCGSKTQAIDAECAGRGSIISSPCATTVLLFTPRAASSLVLSVTPAAARVQCNHAM